jgi:hypothetical protein
MSRSYTSAKRDFKGLDVTFTLDDVEFTCAGRPTALDISELAEVAELGVDTDDPRAVAAMAKFFRVVLGKEYGRFKEHMRAYDTGEDVLIEIMQGILEDLAARPTQEPSRSPDGPSTTGPTSKVVSLQRGSIHMGQPGSAAAAAVSSPSPSVPSSPSYSLYG